MVLITEIEEALKPKKTEVVGIEDEILADSVLKLDETRLPKSDEHENITLGEIRKKVENTRCFSYPGKPTTRKKAFEINLLKKPPIINKPVNSYNYCKDSEHVSMDSDIDGSYEEEHKTTSEDDDLIDNNEGDEMDNNVDGYVFEYAQTDDSALDYKEYSSEEDSSKEDFSEEDSSKEDSSEEDDKDLDSYEESSDFGGSITGADYNAEISSGEEGNTESADAGNGIDIFSAKARDINYDVAKGKSIRNQLNIWEKLIESRIKLQPDLYAVNKLFQGEDLKAFKSQLNSDEIEQIDETYSVLKNLMKSLIELQNVTLNAAPEYREIKNMKRQNENDDSDYEVAVKKRRSTDYLQEIHENFKPFMEASIQKWNEKTRISHGRIKKSDFSAFDQPTLKQVDEILLDRARLLKRTQTKRSVYQILGKTPPIHNENESKIDTQECNPEIFDDDDFYHKLLRDFIENKTSDNLEFSKKGKQWIDLQKLRSRMKAKVDTRASKGRKIRFAVHKKMVHFMPPIPSYKWTDEKKDDLFQSLFAKKQPKN